jgi:hypothetical protein
MQVYIIEVCQYGLSGNAENCPYCRARRTGKTNEEKAEELMKRVAVNDAGEISALGSVY